MEVASFLKGTFKYDEMGQYIWLVEADGNHQKIADLRGWGAIQNLFKSHNGQIDLGKAAEFQDVLGKWIVDALAEKLERERSVVSPNLTIGQMVYHKDIYDGNEQLEVVGLRKKEVELEGDYSGGTHNVCQRSWMPIEGVFNKK